MTRTGKIILASAVAAVLLAAVGVKWIFFPAVKDAYFTANNRALRQVPAGLVVVRPTHYPRSSRNGIVSDSVQVSGQRVWRMMGRNVTFKELMAVAYGRSQARVLLPATAPTNRFDFLVTVAANQQARLQAAVRKKLGYTARTETRDTDVLALKIKNGTLPGLTVSAGGKPNVDFNQGKLHFTHMRPGMLAGGLEQVVKLPVVDQTDLTNFYDFSLAMDPKLQRQLQNDATARAAAESILAGWGLGLESDNQSVEMLVVKSVL